MADKMTDRLKRAIDIALADRLAQLELIGLTNAKYAGIVTTVGGAASEDFTIDGVDSGDVAIAILHTEGAAPVTILRAECDDNKVTIEFSGDPAADHVVNLLVFKALA